jgi:hypothetical protein
MVYDYTVSRSEVHAAVSIKFMVSWDVTPCSLVYKYQHFLGFSTRRMEATCSSETVPMYETVMLQ